VPPWSIWIRVRPLGFRKRRALGGTQPDTPTTTTYLTNFILAGPEKKYGV